LLTGEERRGEERSDEWKVLVLYEGGVILLLSLLSSRPSLQPHPNPSFNSPRRMRIVIDGMPYTKKHNPHLLETPEPTIEPTNSR